MRGKKWKGHSRVREKRQEKATRYWKKYRRHRNRENNVRSSGAKIERRGGITIRVEVVSAPKHFSLLGNYEETNRFFQVLRGYLSRNKPVHVGMKDVDILTIDAILVLVALIKGRKRRGINVSGDIPTSEAPAQMMHRSGFYEHFQSALYRSKSQAQGGIVQRKGRRVNPELADQLAQDTQETITGIRADMPSAYRILLELMGNTRQHAKPIQKKKSLSTRNVEPWWVLLDCDKKEKIARFAFYDGGVGIIQSLRPRLQQWMAKLGAAPQDTDLIHDIMNGRNISRTGLPFRGKGLPAISSTLKQGKIKALTIITNSVFADVTKNQYVDAPVPFQGTLIYWEIAS